MANVDSITKENFRLLLAAFMDENDLQARKVAKAIPCSERSINRLISGITHPTDEMMKQAGLLFATGYKTYSKLKASDKEKLSSAIAASGGAVGFASITTVISASGTVIGLSGPGIVAGLSALGSIVGGGMAAGLVVTAAIPVAASAAGYGIFKGVMSLIEKKKLDSNKFDPKWEVQINVIDADPSLMENEDPQLVPAT